MFLSPYPTVCEPCACYATPEWGPSPASPATQDALLQRLQSQRFSLLSGTVDTKGLAAEGPKAVLFCLRDHSADYLGMAARLGGDYHVVTTEGSHEMFFANPEDYTKALLKLVSAVHC